VTLDGGDRPERGIGRAAALLALAVGSLVASVVVVMTADTVLLPVAVLAVGLVGMVAASAITWWLTTLVAAAAGSIAIAVSDQPSPVAYAVWAGVLLAAVAASFWAFTSRARARSVIAYLEARARHHSLHDELSGLLNLRGAELVGGGLLELARRDGDALFAAIICLEDDGLTMTAHERDDAVLTVTEAASAVFRGSDVLARVSTDCLLVVAKGGGLRMELVAHRMGRAIAELGEGSGPMPTVTVGAALLPPWEGGTLADLIELARRDLVMQWSLRQQEVARGQQVIELDPKRRRVTAADPYESPNPPASGPGSEEFPGDIRF
jgi:GGDEF domain-containing protein